MRFPDNLVRGVDTFRKALRSTDMNEIAVRSRLDSGGWSYRLLDIAQSSVHSPQEAIAPMLTSVLTAIYFIAIPPRLVSNESVKRATVTHKF